MSHRGTAHASRRRNFLLGRQSVDWGLPQNEWAAATNSHVTPDFDDTTYDDVIPHRLRGTIILDEHGEPAGLTDLVADRSLT